jgi:uncharacterized protein YlxW (UPF0749 family)
MNGGQTMVVMIVALVMITGILKSIFGLPRGGRRGRQLPDNAAQQAETLRLRDEVKQLKERLHVLERITVEKENSLEREIERLRDS